MVTNLFIVSNLPILSDASIAIVLSTLSNLTNLSIVYAVWCVCSDLVSCGQTAFFS